MEEELTYVKIMGIDILRHSTQYTGYAKQRKGVELL